jgi:hypothetical protein
MVAMPAISRMAAEMSVVVFSGSATSSSAEVAPENWTGG